MLLIFVLILTVTWVPFIGNLPNCQNGRNANLMLLCKLFKNAFFYAIFRIFHIFFSFQELADRSDPWNLVPFMRVRAGCLDSCRTKDYRNSVINIWNNFRTKYLAPGEVKLLCASSFEIEPNLNFFLDAIISNYKSMAW